jgi:hypothetical protein
MTSKKRNFSNGFLALDENNDDNKIPQQTKKQDENKDNQKTKQDEEAKEEKNEVDEDKLEKEPKVPEIQQVEAELVVQETMGQIVKKQLEITKKHMDLFYGNTTAFGKTIKKPKFSEMYSGVTISMNRDLNEIIEYLVANSTYNKTQLLELLLITGLESLNFDE